MLDYMIYILAFVVGSILGLVYSYKQHGEPFVDTKLNIVAAVIAVVGWILAFNSGNVNLTDLRMRKGGMLNGEAEGRTDEHGRV